MKTQSTIMPNAAFKIEIQNRDNCDILFYCNVREVEVLQGDGESKTLLYEYDMYRLNAIYRNNLSEIIESSYDEWLRLAIAKEEEYLIEKPSIKERMIFLENNHKKQKIDMDTCLLANANLFEAVLSNNQNLILNNNGIE